MRARKVVAWNIRRLRVAKGLSQEALAVDAGVDRTYISGIERETENPSLDILEGIAGALGTTLVRLLRVPMKGEAAPELLRRGRKPGYTR